MKRIAPAACRPCLVTKWEGACVAVSLCLALLFCFWATLIGDRFAAQPGDL